MELMRSDALERPHPKRFPPGHPRRMEVLAAHDAAVRDGRPAYRDPITGYSVFTAAFLAERGTCCTSGCRHCPFVGASDEPDPVGA